MHSRGEHRIPPGPTITCDVCSEHRPLTDYIHKIREHDIVTEEWNLPVPSGCLSHLATELLNMEGGTYTDCCDCMSSLSSKREELSTSAASFHTRHVRYYLWYTLMGCQHAEPNHKNDYRTHIILCRKICTICFISISSTTTSTQQPRQSGLALQTVVTTSRSSVSQLDDHSRLVNRLACHAHGLRC